MTMNRDASLTNPAQVRYKDAMRPILNQLIDLPEVNYYHSTFSV